MITGAEFRIGDVFERLAEIPDGTIDLVLTSPPFLALRSYLPAGHPDKHLEIGSEPTPAAFLDTLLELTAEWRRLLAPHGSIVVELGDTYSGSRDRLPGWPLDKSICGIPWLYALSLAHGYNMARPNGHSIVDDYGNEHDVYAPSIAGRWRVRNVVAWCRPNPPVGALGDKFRPATSYLTVATVARDRWFDLDAVREPASPNTNPRTAKGVDSKPRTSKTSPDGNRSTLNDVHLQDTAPPLDWWEVPTEPYSGSHYATWPRQLLTRPILAMCPERVCTTCGEPSRRIAITTNAEGKSKVHNRSMAGRADQPTTSTHMPRAATRSTLGWTDCGHDTWRPGIVLDPFAGSGTTLAVATGHGRAAIGIDLDARNADLARERVGMFLTITERTTH